MNLNLLCCVSNDLIRFVLGLWSACVNGPLTLVLNTMRWRASLDQHLADIGRNRIAFCPGPVIEPDLYWPVLFRATYQSGYFRDLYVL